MIELSLYENKPTQSGLFIGGDSTIILFGDSDEVTLLSDPFVTYGGGSVKVKPSRIYDPHNIDYKFFKPLNGELLLSNESNILEYSDDYPQLRKFCDNPRLIALFFERNQGTIVYNAVIGSDDKIGHISYFMPCFWDFCDKSLLMKNQDGAVVSSIVDD